jgi:hypothetical protein
LQLESLEGHEMKRVSVLGTALLTIWASACFAQAPQAEIHNKQLRVKFYLPDAKDGFYKGVRFDWSGVIADLEFAGHHIYRPWFVAVDPEARDVVYKDDAINVGINSAMTGPAEEFQTPLGYETAKPGGTFLKIGVGMLKKIDDTPYAFTKHFELVDGGKWTIRKTSNSITFEQVLGDAKSDYGYVYTKTISLTGDSSGLTIEHHLKNVGKLPLSSKLYDHNFLTIDGISVGPGYSITVPYKIEPTRQPDSKFAKIDNDTAAYVVGLQGQDRVAFGLQGFSSDPKDYHFVIKNTEAKFQVTIDGDQTLTNASVWSIRSILAVEPFIDIHADTGKEAAWTYRYTYSTF